MIYRAEDAELNVRCRRQRQFVEYDCWPIGLREVLLPVFFEGKVIAVFFMGQICLDYRQKFVASRLKTFLPSLLKDCHKNSNINTVEVIRSIRKAFHTWYKGRERVLSKNTYNRLIDNAVGEIHRLERALQEQMSLQREEYVRNKISKRIKQLHKGLPTTAPPGTYCLADLWELVGKCMRGLLRDRPTEQSSGQLCVVTHHGDLPENLRRNIRSLKYNLSKLPAELRGIRVSTYDDDRVREGLEGSDEARDSSLNLISVFPVPILQHGAIVLLMGYHNDNPMSSVENRPGSYLDRSIEAFFGRREDTQRNVTKESDESLQLY
jgi:hypothetical protein